MKKEISATLSPMYKVAVGHDGWTPGCGYDGDDKWGETFYGATIQDLAAKMSANSNYVLGHVVDFDMWLIEAIEYEGCIYTHRVLNNYYPYGDSRRMMDEYNQLQQELKSESNTASMDSIRSAAKAEREQQERERQQKVNEEKRANDIAQLERLKKLYPDQ